MRLIHAGLVLAITVTFLAAAAYERKVINDYMAYANHMARMHSQGDAGDSSGWRECTEMESTPTSVGVACEGVRTMSIYGNQRVDVNYFCEFHFSKTEPGHFTVSYQLCQ